MKGPKNKSKKVSPPAGFAMPGVNVVQLERLLDFMAAHGLDEFEYEHGGLHIRLRKAAGSSHSFVRSHPAQETPAGSSAAAHHAQDSAGAHDPSAPSPAAAAPAEELHVIKSPIVGTFYSAPSPEAPPFVKVGDSTQVGQVVCIIEAMKLMNEIEADVSGQIVRVLVENGQPVEYGQPLFAIRPEKKK